jgi:hypothetical protein
MIDNSIVESLKSIWFNLIILSFFVAVISFFWGIPDMILLMRFGGKIKRGIKVWSKPLSREAQQYLCSITADVIEKRKTWISDTRIGFIRVDNKEVLIQYRRPHWSTSWPYIGYVDLTEPDPILQFRSSLPTHLFLLPFVLSIFAIPFVLAFMLFNYYMESTAI